MERLKYCEDVVIWHEARLAIISSDPGRAQFNAFTGEGDEAAALDGQLWVYHLDTRRLAPLHISNWPSDRKLHTLGLGILEQASAPHSPNELHAILSAANYSQKAASIEMLRLTVKTGLSASEDFTVNADLIHTFVHKDLTSPNAVFPLSRSQVLFTQSYGASPRKHPILFKLEQLVAWPGGSVKLATLNESSGESTVSTLVRNISMANGLAMNGNRTVVAVSACTSHAVQIYDFQPPTNEAGSTTSFQLRHRQCVPVSFLPDNLSFVPNDYTGRAEVLLATGHPDALDFLKTAKNPFGVFKAPSRVAKIMIQPRGHPRQSIATQAKSLFVESGKEVQTIFESRGDYMATSSTAASYLNAKGEAELLVCGLWDDGLLVCKDVDVRVP